MKGFIIGGTSSGSGKTTVSMAIMAWLTAKGYKVAPFKVGPDFIDPGHHAVITGRHSCNLDSWMLSRSYNRSLFAYHVKDADVAVVEGVMGLFDGFDAVSPAGSTAQMADWLGLDVILVVDAGGMARSAAAMVRGFEIFDSSLSFAGVIFTRVGSPSHYQCLKTAVEAACDMPCLGYLPKNPDITLKERHLGLVTASELQVDSSYKNTLVSMVDRFVEMETLLETVTSPKLASCRKSLFSKEPLQFTKKPRIAVAKDDAFCFYYQDNLSFLTGFGAQIVFFSPMQDSCLPSDISGIYLGGGYPELYTPSLSGQDTLLAQVRENCQAGMPIFAECGGFMYLCSAISDMDKNGLFPMAGCFPFQVKMHSELKSLGYREILLTRDTPVGEKGAVLRGHEFHYSSLVPLSEKEEGQVMSDVFQVTGRAGKALSLKGYQVHQTLGSYFHVHFGSNPACAAHFVRKCQEFDYTCKTTLSHCERS